jgi:T-complex protein 1 subunit gamma
MMPGMGGGAPQQQMLVMNPNMKKESGWKAQESNIQAAKAVASIIRSTLGPKAMLKMILDPMGGIVMTNDGNAILREVDVVHPTAKSMIELCRAQDEEVGDGTTSVMVLCGEMMGVAEPLLKKSLHPTVIVNGYMEALQLVQSILEEIAIPIDTSKKDVMLDLIQASVGTKFVSRWGTMISELALAAARTVMIENPNGKIEVDLKRYARVEKIPGGELEECEVLQGVMFNKDVTHHKMRRDIKNPRVILIDCPLEYKKNESNTNVEITNEQDWEAMLMQEEEEVQKLCDDIIKLKPDVVMTEKGVSDLAQHFLLKANIAVIRRIRKTDNNRVAKACGATIVNRTDELTEADVGTRCGLFKIRKIGDEYFTYCIECEEPKACTVILRGGTKDVLSEVERNLHDAFAVTRNLLIEPRQLPGGGACEMEVACRLEEKAKMIDGVGSLPVRAVASALEVIPRQLAQNAGVEVVRVITDLRSRHAQGDMMMGIDGETGKLINVKEAGILDSYAVKQQVMRASIETAAMLLRIDQIVSGISHGKAQKMGAQQEAQKKPDDDEDDEIKPLQQLKR